MNTLTIIILTTVVSSVLSPILLFLLLSNVKKIKRAFKWLYKELTETGVNAGYTIRK